MAVGQKYHISQNDDGKWQVKGEKAGKALKLFDTQKEAIAYAKTVAGNQEGNFVIHKLDGKIRKQDYSKAESEKKTEKKTDKKATKPEKKPSADKQSKPAAKPVKKTEKVKPAKK